MSLTGPQKLAVLLCKFSDTSRIEQHPATFYQELFIKRGTGGLNDYWHDTSLGAINLDGSKVFGWKTLKIKKDAFLAAHPGRWDKIKGALDAFPQVVSTKFNGIVAIFNTNVGDAGTQGGVLAGPNDVNGTFLGHETGHVFGLDHSFDQSDRKNSPWSAPGEYFDEYDIMSGIAGDTGHRFSPRGPLLNVAHLDRMGWLPPSRLWQATGANSSGGDTIDIVALEHPEVRGYLAAKLSGVYVEFRMPNGWDAGIGHPCVLLHQRSRSQYRDPHL